MNSRDIIQHASFEFINSISVINFQDYRGETLLHCACEAGKTEIIKLLMEKEADPYIRNYKGYTCFQKAHLGNCYEELEHQDTLRKMRLAKLFQEKKCGIVVSGKIITFLYNGDETDNMRLALNS